MARYKMVGNNRIELTAEELTVLNARETTWSNGALDRALNKLREKRNKLLVETDWMANSDVTMSDDWKTYRQALRDITSELDTVEKVNTKLKVDEDKTSETYGKYINFPTKPGA
jgi:soluble cytochrome b562